MDILKEQENEMENVDSVVDLAERLDFTDIQILRKFYATGKEFPDDSRPHCFPILYKEMRSSRQIKLGLEALRKRLDGLVVIGFLEKVKHSNPVNYYPVKDKERIITSYPYLFYPTLC